MAPVHTQFRTQFHQRFTKEAGDLRLDVHVEMESSAPQILQHAQHLKEVRGILKDMLITAAKTQ